MHRNFKSVNVLLDDDLAVRVSDCGLAPLLSRASVSQVSCVSSNLLVFGFHVCVGLLADVVTLELSFLISK